MGAKSYTDAYGNFHRVTTENLGLRNPTMFGEVVVVEADVVESRMCCSAVRYRAGTDGVTRIHLDRRTLEETSQTFVDAGNEAAWILDHMVRDVTDDFYRKRTQRLVASPYFNMPDRP